eukprot:gb/GECG01011422.1/.p1 GENE.gb/GECG01011422.1/~~gb/GECG01011422.1/.p1  ORF type:complete len:487 (+),score=89.35 gb/GECG01011422.1/:1-1461(+)
MSLNTQQDANDNNTSHVMTSSGQKRALQEEDKNGSSSSSSQQGNTASNDTQTTSSEAHNASAEAEASGTTKRRRRRRFFSSHSGSNGSSNADEIPDEQLPPSSTLQQDISNLQAQILTIDQRDDFSQAQKEKVTNQIKQAISTKQKLLERAQKKEAENNPLLNADFSSLGEMAGMTGAVAKDALRRRIYVGNIYYEIREPELRSVFQPFGNITAVEMSNDPLTGKHKGYCFLEYDTPEAAETAISVMNGFELAGRKIRVGRPHIAPGSAVSQVPGFDMNNVANAAAAQASLPTQDATATAPTTAQSEQAENSQTETTTATDEAPASSGNDSETEVSQTVKAPATASENKKVAEAASKAAKIAASFAAGGGASGFGMQQNPNCRIYVGSVPFEMQAEHVQQIFEPFGRIVSCNMLPPLETTQPGQQHRGYGFIEFDNEESANSAIQTMNGFNIAGRMLKVNRATSPGNATQTMGAGAFGAAYWPAYT